MGKRIIQQRRGKGARYLSPSHRFAGAVSYPVKTKENLKGEVIDIINSVGHSTPLMVVKYEDNQTTILPAPIGIRVGQQISYLGSKPELGSALQLKNIPLGSSVYNIEVKPGENGKLLRASGASAIVLAKEKDKVVVKLPSKKQVKLNLNCIATIGVAAGSGRKTKPLTKAGNAYHKKKAKNKLVSKVKGVAMNAVDHPHGKTHRRHRRKSTTVRTVGKSPGQKVGLLAARKSGRGK